MANDFNKFFSEKIKLIRKSIPTVNEDLHNSMDFNEHLVNPSVSNSSCLSEFAPCTDEEVLTVLQNSGIKMSPMDIHSAKFMSENKEFYVPYLKHLINLSLKTGSIAGLKEAIVRPLLKEHDANSEDFSKYRPISNLSFFSKLIERIVLSRLQKHMHDNNLNNNRQFGYKKHHSTETLLLKFTNDLIIGMDSKNGVVVLLMDLSAAFDFDTVDQRKLLNILCFQLNIRGSALSWFKSFLIGRSQKVMVGSETSDPVELSFGVPQGSVLGPVLFNIYISSINDVFSASGFSCIGYADDNSGYQVFNIDCASVTLNNSIPLCIELIQNWMFKYFLKLNESKTKIIVFGTNHFHNQFQINQICTNAGSIIDLDDSIKYLGVYLDESMCLDSYINRLVSECFYHLKNIAKIKRYLIDQQTPKLVHAFVSSKMDYCNAILFGFFETPAGSKLCCMPCMWFPFLFS